MVKLNLSFANVEFQDRRIGQRGGGIRELHSQLRHAQRTHARQAMMLQSAEGVEERRRELIDVAIQRASGARVRDDPTRLRRKLARKRSQKRSSAKKWAARGKQLQDSIDNAAENRDEEKKKKSRNLHA